MSDNADADRSGGGASGDRGRRRRRRHPKREQTPVKGSSRKDSTAAADSRESTPVPATTPLTPTRTPIILAKPDRHDSAEETSQPGASTGKPVDRPIIVKMREDPHGGAAAAAAPDSYRIQKSFIPLSDGTPQSRMAPPPEISQSVKLVDESMQWSDMGMEMLVDQTEYLVIGVIGPQSVGKSTVMASLAGWRNGSTPPVFKPATGAVLGSSGHQTSGIDMYVTSERVILLDTQPVLSSSVLFDLIDREKKIPPEFTSAENYHEIRSLQTIAFMYTVCNVVIVTIDWFADLFLLKFLQTAEMLKPPTPDAAGGAADEHVEYYPHLVFVLNKAESVDFSYTSYTAMERTISKVFKKSKLRYRGSHVTTCDGQTLLSKLQLNDERVNLFLLPKYDDSKSASKSDSSVYSTFLPEYRGHPGFDFLIGRLRNQLYSVPRSLLTHTTLSEKNWFHYAARTWDSIHKFQLFAEYNRLLP
ncbi:nonsense-mediated mRNA decay factor SMG9-like [Tubulanus polymorphus]|uniref:nonsense-mediated mRNA decay factor SMG9-like n=1 Tax=Tubulanus polymorphus TaxID=672921 RepID=UPI003DA2FE21